MGQGRGRYNTEQPNLAEMVADLTRRVQSLETGNRAGATSVDKGTFNVRSGSLAVGDIALIGRIDFGYGETPGWIFRRADGTVAFTLGGQNDGDQFWALWDNQQNIVMSDDGASDAGLARPWLPIQWVESSAVLPTVNTSSGTFSALWTAKYIKQHPRVYVQVLTYCSDGTTAGEVRLAVAGGGAQIGATQVAPAGFYGLLTIGPESVDADHMGEVELEVQVRRTAGAGTVGVRVYGSYAVQS